jgi:linoleoyl-CoA desaturase
MMGLKFTISSPHFNQKPYNSALMNTRGLSMSQVMPEILQYSEAPELKEKLHKEVQHYFETTGFSRSGGRALAWKIAIIFSWFLASYFAALWASSFWSIAVAAVSLGLAVGGIGLCIQHESNHGACFRSKFVNRLLGLSLDLIGGSSYYWRWSHGLHHRYPNVQDLDYDIDIMPVLRLAPWQERLCFHKFQRYYVWILFSLVAPKWNFIDDYRDFIRGTVGEVVVARPKGLELLFFCGFKIFFYTWAFVIPFLIHGWLYTLFIYCVWSSITGVVLGALFQLGHLTYEAETTLNPGAAKKLDSNWLALQIQNTANFKTKSRFLSWYTGGLNFQIEHHLYPHISHIHYPQLAVIVEQFCRENSIDYHSYSSFREALSSHARNLAELGQAKVS